MRLPVNEEAVQRRIARARTASEAPVAGSTFRSLAALWHHRVESTPDGDAMWHRAGGAWVRMTWREAGARVRTLADGFLAEGLRHGDRVAILATTRVEWVLADFAILCAGGATTAIYPTHTDAALSFILRDSGARFVVCDDVDQAQRLIALRGELPDVASVWVIDADGLEPGDGWVRPLEVLASIGARWAAAHPGAYDAARESVAPDDLATLIYTSGTTGEPKGVMLTHEAWVYETQAVDALGLAGPADLQFLFLPLSHVFAKVTEALFVHLGIPTVVDGDRDALLANLRDRGPTFLAGVPRTFEKGREGVLREVASRGPVARRLFDRALQVGAAMSRAKRAKQRPSLALRAEHAALDRAVLAPIRARFGGRLRFLISGGAPLSVDVAEFFWAIGLPILEGWGLTETAAATCVDTLTDPSLGSVGRPLPGSRVRIAEDGEILVSGPGVMTGYWNRPADTAEAFTEDGWLKTGDVGLLLPTGHLRITDRKKDLIVTSSGKNVAPSPIENAIKTRSPLFGDVVLHGDRRPYVVALVTLDPASAPRWARERGLSFTDLADLAARPEVRDEIRAHVDAVNRGLAPWETLKTFAVLPEPFTVENGLVTPTLKVRRRAVEARWADLLDALYR